MGAIALWTPLSVWVTGACASGPLPGTIPLDKSGQMHFSKQDRCPVCGMRIIKYARFACAIQLKDKDTFYFCGASCLLKTWLRPDLFLGKPARELFKPVIQEYFSGKQMDARNVIWISGSNVIGPMGPALVPLQDEKHLQAFKKRHGGKHVFKLEDLNEKTWQIITGNKPAE
jgi:nitrous oxide reductase accessory protein NosL